jgi:hypothetical protein
MAGEHDRRWQQPLESRFQPNGSMGDALCWAMIVVSGPVMLGAWQ